MERRELRAKITDEVLRLAAGGACLTLGLLAPGSVVGLSKPLDRLLDKLDKRDREREMRQVVYRMKERGLLVGDYEHGLQLTAKARRRLAKVEIDALVLKPKKIWDGRWRIVVYDIPSSQQTARHQLQSNLLRYGCIMLQKSTWITPFPCRQDVAAIASQYKVDSYISFFEAINLDNAEQMIKRFQKRYPDTTFKIPKKIPMG